MIVLPQDDLLSNYFFLLFFAGLDFLVVVSESHSDLSAVSKPPKPTMIKINGQRFQKSFGSIPTWSAKNINPITTMAAGQKYDFDIIILSGMTGTYISIKQKFVQKVER
jgi:hypothetical protein